MLRQIYFFDTYNDVFTYNSNTVSFRIKYWIDANKYLLNPIKPGNGEVVSLCNITARP